MMKKIITAGLLTSFMSIAVASEPSVTVYGKMRIFQESYKEGTSGTITKQTNDSSRLGFKGSEDLGNGLGAFFVLETSVGADEPSTTSLGDRTSIVGLKTSQGSLALGKDKHSVTRALDNFDSMGNVYGSSVGNIHSSQGSRVDNASFLSFSPVKGVTVNYQHATSETSGVKAVQAGSIDVSAGPLSGTVAHYDDKINNKSTIIGGKFNLETTGTSLFVLYSDDSVSGVENEGKTVGLNQKISSNVILLASYGEKSGLKAMNAGATYNLSKRTMVHARFVKEDSTLAANDLRRVGLGIEHNF